MRRRGVVAAGLACLLMVWGIRTYTQALTWQDDAALWGHAARISPNLPRPWINLAIALERDERPAEARWAYQRAADLALTRVDLPARERQENVAAALTNLGRLQARDDLALGLQTLHTAVHLFSGFAPARLERAILLGRAGSCEAARWDLDAVQALTGQTVGVRCAGR